MLNSAVVALQTCYLFEFLKPLGRGTYGDVIKMWDPSQSTAIAVKVVSSESVAEGELKYWPTLRHAHVVPLEEVITLQNKTVIFIMPLYFKTLEDMLWETEFFHNPNSILCVKLWLKQALHGLEYIHAKDLCHLDVKMDNVLISYDSSALLGDFSFLSHTSQTLSWCEVGLPFIYRPPEARSTLETTYIEGKSCDMWGFGIMIVESFTRQALSNTVEECHSWEDEVYPVLLKMLQRDEFRDYVKKSFPSCEFTLKEEDKCIDFIKSFLHLDPMVRITAGSAAKHPFLDISKEACSAALEIALKCPGFTQNHDPHHQEKYQSSPSSTLDAGCHGDTSSTTKVENIFSAENRLITPTSEEDNRTADVSATDANFLSIRTPILPRRRRPLSSPNPAYTNPNDSQLVVYDLERSQDAIETSEKRTCVIGYDGSNVTSHSWLRPMTSERTGRKRDYEKDFKLTGAKKKKSYISGVKQRISDRREKVENNSTSSVDDEKIDHKRITKSRRKPYRKRRVAEPDVDEFKFYGCGTPAKDRKNGSSTILSPRKNCVGHRRSNSTWKKIIGMIEVGDASDVVIDSHEIPLKLASTRIFSPSSLLSIKCERKNGSSTILSPRKNCVGHRRSNSTWKKIIGMIEVGDASDVVIDSHEIPLKLASTRIFSPSSLLSIKCERKNGSSTILTPRKNCVGHRRSNSTWKKIIGMIEVGDASDVVIDSHEIPLKLASTRIFSPSSLLSIKCERKNGSSTILSPRKNCVGHRRSNSTWKKIIGMIEVGDASDVVIDSHEIPLKLASTRIFSPSSLLSIKCERKNGSSTILSPRKNCVGHRRSNSTWKKIIGMIEVGDASDVVIDSHEIPLKLASTRIFSPSSLLSIKCERKNGSSTILSPRKNCVGHRRSNSTWKKIIGMIEVGDASDVVIDSHEIPLKLASTRIFSPSSLLSIKCERKNGSSTILSPRKNCVGHRRSNSTWKKIIGMIEVGDASDVVIDSHEIPLKLASTRIFSPSSLLSIKCERKNGSSTILTPRKNCVGHRRSNSTWKKIIGMIEVGDASDVVIDSHEIPLKLASTRIFSPSSLLSIKCERKNGSSTILSPRKNCVGHRRSNSTRKKIIGMIEVGDASDVVIDSHEIPLKLASTRIFSPSSLLSIKCERKNGSSTIRSPRKNCVGHRRSNSTWKKIIGMIEVGDASDVVIDSHEIPLKLASTRIFSPSSLLSIKCERKNGSSTILTPRKNCVGHRRSNSTWKKIIGMIEVGDASDVVIDSHEIPLKLASTRIFSPSSLLSIKCERKNGSSTILTPRKNCVGHRRSNSTWKKIIGMIEVGDASDVVIDSHEIPLKLASTRIFSPSSLLSIKCERKNGSSTILSPRKNCVGHRRSNSTRKKIIGMIEVGDASDVVIDSHEIPLKLASTRIFSPSSLLSIKCERKNGSSTIRSPRKNCVGHRRSNSTWKKIIGMIEVGDASDVVIDSHEIPLKLASTRIFSPSSLLSIKCERKNGSSTILSPRKNCVGHRRSNSTWKKIIGMIEVGDASDVVIDSHGIPLKLASTRIFSPSSLLSIKCERKNGSSTILTPRKNCVGHRRSNSTWKKIIGMIEVGDASDVVIDSHEIPLKLASTRIFSPSSLLSIKCERKNGSSTILSPRKNCVGHRRSNSTWKKIIGMIEVGDASDVVIDSHEIPLKLASTRIFSPSSLLSIKCERKNGSSTILSPRKNCVGHRRSNSTWKKIIGMIEVGDASDVVIDSHEIPLKLASTRIFSPSSLLSIKCERKNGSSTILSPRKNCVGHRRSNSTWKKIIGMIEVGDASDVVIDSHEIPLKLASTRIFSPSSLLSIKCERKNCSSTILSPRKNCVGHRRSNSTWKKIIGMIEVGDASDVVIDSHEIPLKLASTRIFSPSSLLSIKCERKNGSSTIRSPRKNCVGHRRSNSTWKKIIGMIEVGDASDVVIDSHEIPLKLASTRIFSPSSLLSIKCERKNGSSTILSPRKNCVGHRRSNSTWKKIIGMIEVGDASDVVIDSHEIPLKLASTRIFSPSSLLSIKCERKNGSSTILTPRKNCVGHRRSNSTWKKIIGMIEVGDASDVVIDSHEIPLKLASTRIFSPSSLLSIKCERKNGSSTILSPRKNCVGHRRSNSTWKKIIGMIEVGDASDVVIDSHEIPLKLASTRIFSPSSLLSIKCERKNGSSTILSPRKNCVGHRRSNSTWKKIIGMIEVGDASDVVIDSHEIPLKLASTRIFSPSSLLSIKCERKNGSSTILSPRKNCVGHRRSNSTWKKIIGMIEVGDASDVVIDSHEIPLKLASTRIFSPSSLLSIKCERKNGSSTILSPRKNCVGHRRSNSTWKKIIGMIEVGDASDVVIDSHEIPLKLASTRIFSPSSLLSIKCEAHKGTDKDLGKGGDHSMGKGGDHSTMKEIVSTDCFCKYQSHLRKNTERSFNISIEASRLLKNLVKDVFEEQGNVNAAKDHLSANKKTNISQTSGSESSLECKRWKNTGASSVISSYLSSRDGRSEHSLSSVSGDAPRGSAEIQKSRDSDKFTSMSCSAFGDQKVSHQIFSQHSTKRFNHQIFTTGSLQNMSKPELIHLVCKQSNHSDKFVLMKADEEQVSSSSGELFYSFERDSVVLKNDVFKSPNVFRTDCLSNIKSKTFTTSDEKDENVEPENPTITWVKRLANACQQETRDNILSELLPQSLLVLSKDLKKDLAKFITSLFFDANLIVTKERLPVQSTVEEKEENQQEMREDAPESSSNMRLSFLKQSKKILNGAKDIESSLDEDTTILGGDALMETKKENEDATIIEFEDPPHHSRFVNKFRDLFSKKLSHFRRVPIGGEGEKSPRIDSSKCKRLICDDEAEVTEVFDECWEAISYLCDSENVESNLTAQFENFTDDKDVLLPERFYPKKQWQDDHTEMERAYESYPQKNRKLSAWYKSSKTTWRTFFCCLPGPSVD